MSRIYFHSQSGTAEVSGRERANAGLLCHNLFCLSIGLTGAVFDVDVYRRMLPGDSYVLAARDDVTFLQNFRSFLLVSSDAELLLPDGSRISPFTAALNTAVVAGSDPVRLLAKLHGQCELHAYVEGPHRAWLAEIIEAGIRDNVLRTWKDDAYGGWPAVVELLRRRDDEPVVTSYSVCRQFPDVDVARDSGVWKAAAKWQDEQLSEAWDALPDDEQWRLALAGLRKMNEKSYLEIKPDNFAQQGYGSGISGFDIAKMIGEE